jgi:hypothetical protein
MIVVLVNSCREVGFERKDFLRPPSGSREKEKKGYRQDGDRQLRRCHKKLTINEAGGVDEVYHGLLVPSSKDTRDTNNSLHILAPVAGIFL